MIGSTSGSSYCTDPDKWRADSEHGLSKEDAQEHFKKILNAYDYLMSRLLGEDDDEDENSADVGDYEDDYHYEDSDDCDEDDYHDDEDAGPRGSSGFGGFSFGFGKYGFH